MQRHLIITLNIWRDKMREIKFRAWDKKYNEMIYPNYAEGNKGFQIIDKCPDFIELRITPSGKIYEDHGIGNWVWRDDVILMQYIGLKDRNGKEIYEGDIIKSDPILIYPSEFIGISSNEVVYNEKTASFCVMIDNSLFPISIITRDIEIIGNIYKNPELLEDKNV